MKILLLRNNVIDNSVLDQGIVLVKQKLSSIGFPIELPEQVTNTVFTGITGKNAENQDIVFIPPQQISVFKGSNDAVILIFDADKVSPRPTNPVDNGPIIQIPCQWFTGTPEGFCDYFLHELSHLLFTKSGKQDITHLIVNRNLNPTLYDQLNIGGKPASEFYLYLITSLKSVWGTTAPQRTLRIGDKGEDVKELQRLLGITADGSFGPITKRVVVAFQLSKKLIGDGIVGPKTWAELKKKPKLTLEEAIIQVESSGNINAIGDKGLKHPAYGPMQIRQPVCIDVNKKFGTNYKSTDCLGNLALSLDIWNKYQSIYNPQGSNEEKSRTWNGGPTWYKRPHLTDGYWAKVKKLLQ